MEKNENERIEFEFHQEAQHFFIFRIFIKSTRFFSVFWPIEKIHTLKNNYGHEKKEQNEQNKCAPEKCIILGPKKKMKPRELKFIQKIAIIIRFRHRYEFI